MIARVQPLTRTRAVRGPFDYRLTAEQSDVGVGSLLRVPLRRPADAGRGGRAGRALRARAADRLAEPEAVVGAGLPADLVEAGGVDGARVLLDPRPGAVADARARGGRQAGPHAGPAGAGRRADRRRRRRAAEQRARPGSPTASGRSLQALRERGADDRRRAGDERAAPPRGTGPGRAGAAGARPPARPARAGHRLGDRARADRRAGRRPADDSRRPGAPAAARPSGIPAAGGDRLGQDRGLPGRRCGRAGRRAVGDRPRPRDRADPAGPVALSGALRRRGGGAALGAQPGRAPRRVDAAAQRRGPGVRRAALGGVRSRRRSSV